MIDENAIRIGVAAKSLSDNDDFKTFMNSVRVEAYRDWSTSLPNEKDKREDAYQLMRAVDRLLSNMEALASNAKFEQRKAEREAAEQSAKAKQPNGE